MVAQTSAQQGRENNGLPWVWMGWELQMNLPAQIAHWISCLA